MTDLFRCAHGDGRVPIEIRLGCTCSDVGIGVAPGTACALCGFDFRKGPGWGPNGAVEDAFRERHFSSGDHDRILEERRLAKTREVEKVERERQTENLRTSEETERRERAEREREAEGYRARQEAERKSRAEREDRLARIDRALLAGQDPCEVSYSVVGSSENEVRARQVALAKLEENRGHPWAESAIDREILSLRTQGVTRDAVRDQLGVGAGRISRVEREAGLGPKRGRGRVGRGSERVGNGSVAGRMRVDGKRRRVGVRPALRTCARARAHARAQISRASRSLGTGNRRP